MFGAFLEGWRRVWRAPVLVLSVTLAMLLVAAPLAIRPVDLLGRDLDSTIQTTLAQMTAAWAGDQHVSSSTRAGAALYAIIGVGGALPAAYVLFWALLAAGILDRFARGRPVGTAQFFAACGVYLGRFMRLGLMVGATYAVTFLLLRPRSGRIQFVSFLATLALASLIADFARVRAVVEDRRSMLGALAAALRFIRHHPVSTAVLYSLNLVAAVGLVLLWERVLPLNTTNAWPAAAAFAAGLGYLLVRIVTRLACMASEVVFFQRRLSHADYTASPELVWPDSPAVEAINNLTERKAPQRGRRERAEGHDGSAW